MALAFAALLLAASGGLASTFTFTTNYGAPVDNARHSQTVGAGGPVLLQDGLMVERIQVHNRERIPERNMHARGAAAKGIFELTVDWSNLTNAKVFHHVGKRTPVACRWSTTIHPLGSPEFLRDPRGFAVKMYTEEGNYDIVGLNFPVFFIRDGIRFPDMGRALKPNPRSGVQEWWRIWDFFSSYPESTHMFTWLLDDIGIPRNYRVMDGWGMHTYKWIGPSGKETWVRYTFDSWACKEPLDKGCGFADDKEAAEQMFSEHTHDLYETIRTGKFQEVGWTVYVQLMDPTDAALLKKITFDPLDVTREWPTSLFPLMELGRMYMTENPASQFLENEQLAFSPSRVVPGIELSDDKLLQIRSFAYPDTQRYRLGVNNQMLPINRPKCPYYDQHEGGTMNFATDLKDAGDQAVSEVNYFPSKTDPSLREAPAFPHDPQHVEGKKVREEITQTMSDFEQAGARFESMDNGRKDRLAHRIAITLSGERVTQEVKDIWLTNFGSASHDLRHRIERYLSHYAYLESNPSAEHDLYKKLRAFRDGFRRTSGF